MTLRFHHVGVGVLSLDAAVAEYEALGYRQVCRIDDPGLNIRIAFVADGSGGPLIELLAPLGDNGPLAGLIKRGLLPSPYHTCYAVADLAQAGEMLRRRGFLPVQPPRPALAFRGAEVAFFLSPVIGLVELVAEPAMLAEEGDNR